MILHFTDFGWQGPYLGEMEAVLLRGTPEVPVVRLMADAPAFDPEGAGLLLARLFLRTAPGDLLLAVVDPGVGTSREALAVEADGRWLVGPDNGLFEHVLRGARTVRAHRIAWRPADLSASFHGRDLFAPVAARLARGDDAGIEPHPPTRFPDWSDEPPRVVYADGYGNLMTGLDAARTSRDAVIEAAGRRVRHARTFGEAWPGEPFWYGNSLGLVEVALREASAAAVLNLAPGAPVRRA
ncbi:MAG: SAM-dependent chlorinase/fluorinase [Geminicoccaceae bacterium]|nr:SAM-dependent chlorinase/fluorinase [Geminicoccaceae bacterium]